VTGELSPESSVVRLGHGWRRNCLGLLKLAYTVELPRRTKDEQDVRCSSGRPTRPPRIWTSIRGSSPRPTRTIPVAAAVELSNGRFALAAPTSPPHFRTGDQWAIDDFTRSPDGRYVLYTLYESAYAANVWWLDVTTGPPVVSPTMVRACPSIGDSEPTVGRHLTRGRSIRVPRKHRE